MDFDEFGIGFGVVAQFVIEPGKAVVNADFVGLELVGQTHFARGIVIAACVGIKDAKVRMRLPETWIFSRPLSSRVSPVAGL
ncbi:MAG TPA: hypothetical protein VME18_00125 [Acidobacteriaceae bacterium]|nr:hypothetical protein [Acidobacteriaceae bacterium]